MHWVSPVLTTVLVVVFVLLFTRGSYNPWYAEAPLRPVRLRRRKSSADDGEETCEYYVGMHWSPKCADAHAPPMVMDDDDDDVPLPSDDIVGGGAGTPVGN